MSAVAMPFPRAFVVRFSELDRWDPPSFHRILWHWPSTVMRPLGSVLRMRKEKVDRANIAFADLQPITIHFDGSMDRRQVDAGREYSMDLFYARPGDIVVAKIDLKNGAVSIVPDDWPNAVVTGHFAVYEADRSLLVPEYLHLIIQTAFFKAHLWRNKVGAEGRKEVKLDFFESQAIPLPPLSGQRRIVAAWATARKKQDAAYDGLHRTISELDVELRQMTRLDALHRPCLIARWKNLEALDMKSARAALFRLDNPSFRLMGDFVGEATEIVKPWEQPDKEWPVYGVNNRDGVVFSHLQRGKDFNAPYKRIRKDWFFHNPTRSSVGSLGIVPDVPADAITSPEYQVWKITTGLLPEYVATLIATPFFVDLIQVHRVGAVKQRLYVENLLQIPIPSVGEATQRRIVNEREMALRRVVDAKAAMETAKADVEAMILGTRPVA